jgi:hypothetical protein
MPLVLGSVTEILIVKNFTVFRKTFAGGVYYKKARKIKVVLVKNPFSRSLQVACDACDY